MKFFLAASVLSLADGFTLPTRTAPQLATRHQSQQKASYCRGLFEKPDLLSEDVIDLELSVLDKMEKNSEAKANGDLGKELFLSNLGENAQVASTNFDVVEEPPVEKAPREGLTASIQPLPVQDDVVDNVSAVLAASEEAMAAAEASLPADIADKLMLQTDDDDAGPAAPVRVQNVSEPVEAPIREILPASSVVGEPVTTEKIVAPRISKILKFAVPAIGVWLCGPLLSLIDTSSVGLLSGTTQQAALNPAVAVTDYAALLIAFLYAGTTNLIAAARESDRGTAGMPRTAKTFVGAMQLSTYVGAGLGFVLFSFARPLLRAIMGNDSISPAVMDAAMKYVRIRALGMPAAAVIGSAQAACLGMQDIRSPLYVLGVAAVVNFMGDMLFVANSNPWIGGAAGAAWATVFSQYAAIAMFVRWLSTCSKPKKPENEKPTLNLSQAILELTGKPKSAGASRRKRFRDALHSFRNPTSSSQDMQRETVVRGGGRLSMQLPKAVEKARTKEQSEEEEFSVRGFLAGRFRGRDLLKFPDKDTVKEVGEYVVPVTTTQVGRVSGYVAMSHVVTSSLGIISMAAQQVIVSLFYCLCPIADSLSLTAQSFVPAIQEKKTSLQRSKALKQTAVNFAKAGAIFGGVMAAAVSCIPLLSGFFTSDLYVASLVNMVAPLLVVFFSVHGVMCSMEGVLLGRKDLNFLGKMYGAFFAVVPYFMLRVKRAALSGSHHVNLMSVWKVFLSYQLFRTVLWIARVAVLQRRTHRAAQEVGDQP